MSRKEAVILVSRAVAVIQLVTALLDITYLPERLFSLHHYATTVSVLTLTNQERFAITYDQVNIFFLIARVLGLLTLTVVLWRCGDWVERLVFSDQPPRPIK